MLDSMFKYMNFACISNNLLSSAVIVLVVLLAFYFIWKRVSRIEDDIVVVKRTQSDLKRQITHGVVIDDNNHKVDLTYRTKDDSSSDISDETFDAEATNNANATMYNKHEVPTIIITEEESKHLMEQNNQSVPNTDQISPAPAPYEAVPESPSTETPLPKLMPSSGLESLKKKTDVKLINLKPNIDDLSEVSDNLSDISSISSLHEENIDFNDLEDSDFEEQIDLANDNVENASDISSVSDILENKILKDMEVLEDDAEA